MRKSLIFLLISLCLGLNSGCKDDASKAGAVGVIDMDKVANAMGWTDQWRTNVQQTQKQCRAEVEAYLKPFRETYEHKADEIAKANNMSKADIEAMKKATQMIELEKLKLNKVQIEELTHAAMIFGQELNSANAQMNQVLQAHQQAMVVACSHAAEPAIRRVAAAEHRSVIMTPGNTVLYTDPSADLTDKVVDDLQHSTQSKVTLPEPPKLDLHAVTPPATQPN